MLWHHELNIERSAPGHARKFAHGILAPKWLEDSCPEIRPDVSSTLTFIFLLPFRHNGVTILIQSCQDCKFQGDGVRGSSG
jgi:hypothetical protein